MFALLVAVPAWADYSPTPRGFQAVRQWGLDVQRSCGGAGPTALVIDQGVWAAADGRLLHARINQPSATAQGSLRPWGVVPLESTLIATEPGCDVSNARENPDGSGDGGLIGAATTTCRLVQSDWSGGGVSVLSNDICGTAVALQPGTLDITVATRDGSIVLYDIDDGTTTPIMGGLAGNPALHLAWAGSTLYYSRVDGGIYEAPSGRRISSLSPVRGLTAPGGRYGMPNHLLAATGSGSAGLVVVPLDGSGDDPIGGAPDLAGALDSDLRGIVVAHDDSIWLLKGTYAPVAPPPDPEPPAAPPVAQPPPPPPPAPAAEPPPPPIPAPPPLGASITQIVTAQGTSSASASAPAVTSAQVPVIGIVPDEVQQHDLAFEGAGDRVPRDRDLGEGVRFMVPVVGLMMLGVAIEWERRTRTEAAVARAWARR